MRTPTSSTLVLCALLTPALAYAKDPFVCASRPDVAAACYRVRGSLRLYNGTPSARIRPRGSKRLLGVKSATTAGNETFVAPREVREAASFDRGLKGVFTVCPLEKARPHKMRTVCIEAAKLE